MVQEFSSGYPVFRCSTPLSKSFPKGQGGGRISTHHTADLSCAHMLLKIIVVVNQLSVYRAVAKWYISKSKDDTVDLNDNIEISAKMVTD